MGLLPARGLRESLARNILVFCSLRVLLKAYVAAFRGMPKMWRKRKEMEKLIRVSKEEILNWFDRFGISARKISLQD